MLRFLLFFFSFFFFVTNSVLADWTGIWETMDQYQSAFTIILKDDGSAYSDYGDGWAGVWKENESGVTISWNNGRRDFVFNGVMGIQRIANASKFSRGYSAFMKKK